MSNTLDKVRKAPHNKTFGVEIECFVPHRNAGIKIGSYYQMWFAGADGSLQDPRPTRRAVEFVSQPLPFNGLNRQIDWLWKKTGGWEHNETCGVHVHVSAKQVSLKRVRQFADKLGAISAEEFCILFGRRPNQYCRNAFDIYSRYRAINFTNAHTVEFRMFSGGDAAWVKECVRRVRIMCHFRGPVTFDSLFEAFTKPEKVDPNA